MTDRYETGAQALREMPTPDQWDEIVRRVRAADEAPIRLDGERIRRRPRWPLLAAAAAAATIIGIGALMTRSPSTVSTDDPAGDTATTGPGPTPTEAPTGPPTSAQPREADPETGTSLEPPEGEVPPDTGEGGTSIAGCRDLVLATQNAPSDIYPAQEPAEANDPRVDQAAWPGLIGVFQSEANTQRAVFVVVGRGFGEGEGYVVDGPGTGEQSRIRPTADGWVGEADIGLNSRTCELSLISIGLSEGELVAFVQGLGHAD